MEPPERIRPQYRHARIEYIRADIAQAAIKEAVEKHHWIPVEEKLPEGTGNYQVVLAGISWPETRMYYGKGEWERLNVVTYWKPIILPAE